MDDTCSIEQPTPESSERHSRRREGNRHPAKGNGHTVAVYINPTTRLEGTLLDESKCGAGILLADASGLSLDQRVRFVLRRKYIPARIRYICDFEEGLRVGLQYEFH
jgi:c-di-GMP-binding flagellar brake protein YcgR